MKLLVLGASGGVGRWLARLAVTRGHHVRALVRPDTPYEAPPEVDVRRGDVLEPGVLDEALQGMDAVVCSLGQRRAGRSPWSKSLSPPDLMARVAPLLIAAMQRTEVQRLVVVSAAGVADSVAQLTGPVRWLVRQGQIGVAYRDLEVMERTLAASDLDWLAVRPVTLADGKPNGRAREVERYAFTSSIRRSEVASWMLAALDEEAPFARRTVLLGS